MPTRPRGGPAKALSSAYDITPILSWAPFAGISLFEHVRIAKENPAPLALCGRLTMLDQRAVWQVRPEAESPSEKSL